MILINLHNQYRNKIESIVPGSEESRNSIENVKIWEGNTFDGGGQLNKKICGKIKNAKSISIFRIL